MLLSDIVARGEREYSNKTALIYRDTPTSYGELAQAVRDLATALRGMGIGAGNRVALLLPNGTPFIFSYYAIASLGAVVVPANPTLKPAELDYIWRDADVCAVITAPPLLPTVETARVNLPNLRLLLTLTAREDLPEPQQAQADSYGLLSRHDNEQAAQANADSSAMANPEFEVQDHSDTTCAVIIYTSGTTGHPKGAMLSHRNLTRNVEQVQDFLQFLPDDVFLTVLPLFHAFAATVCMNCALAAGCASILLDTFHPVRAMEAMTKHGVTIFPGVPVMFNALLAIPPELPVDLSRLRMFVSGGAPLPAPTLERLETRFHIPVLEGDGPTECSPVTSVNPLDGPRKLNSVGPSLPGVEVKVFDEEDRECTTGDVGEIVVRGDNVMLGYLNQPDATADAMRSGWYHTGDLGMIDADGYIFIVDRKKDMIITSGLNVYPREVEDVLLTHPDIADAAVIGQPDALRGEEVVAVVVRKPGAAATERQIAAFCRERLANYKTPRRVLFRETLPRGGTGKVVKRLLRKELEMESTNTPESA